ncbi:lasso peptide biosynthesis B2 protein [Microbacterium sp. MPKO10]|uniref:lasso peptide biosynthesis B2 protein n=1 Tax=Microbacterium sp. MPKO10 TaxID=2989818 RepID=UPI00223582CE|nr:lasso peptide biosynthesis B2 protein [Microbacterium sp. MPKO10]MCW4458858.1 lasso peptide biosynthesis B2 protein [Microbacterium sp. MPKO10]
MSLSRRIRTVLALPPRRWADIVVITIMAARVEVALRKGGVHRAARIGAVHVDMDGTASAPGTPAEAGLTPRELEKLDTAWRVLRHGPFNGTCLRRALVGGYVLRHHRPLLRIGVSKADGTVAAHAWVDVHGVSLDPDGSGQYSPLTSPTAVTT